MRVRAVLARVLFLWWLRGNYLHGASVYPFAGVMRGCQPKNVRRFGTHSFSFVVEGVQGARGASAYPQFPHILYVYRRKGCSLRQPGDGCMSGTHSTLKSRPFYAIGRRLATDVLLLFHWLHHTTKSLKSQVL